jgi:hypothetical protein
VPLVVTLTTLGFLTTLWAFWRMSKRQSECERQVSLLKKQVGNQDDAINAAAGASSKRPRTVWD